MRLNKRNFLRGISKLQSDVLIAFFTFVVNKLLSKAHIVGHLLWTFLVVLVHEGVAFVLHY